MSLTVLNKQFLAVLRKLYIDIDQFPDKSFDGLFEKSCNDSKHFLDWFCENFCHENVLTEEERSAYNELENFRKCISEKSIENGYENLFPSYDDLNLLDSNYINVLNEELENLDVECKQLRIVKSSLESDHNKLKKEHHFWMEENHKWKKKLSDERQTCMIVNADMNNLLNDAYYFLLKKPENAINFSLLDNSTEFENNIYDLFISQYIAVTKNCLQHGNSRSDLYYPELDDKLSVAEFYKIISSGSLEEKKEIFMNLQEACKSKGAEKNALSNISNILNVGYVPKESDENESLKKEIAFIEIKELLIKAKKLSQLELCRVMSQRQLNKLYNVDSLLHKASYYKELLDFEEAISSALLHILNRSVQNITNIYLLITTFTESLNENQMNDSSKYEFMNWRSKRFSEVSNSLNKKHPLVTALNKIMPVANDTLERRNEASIPNVTCIMKSLVQSSAVFPQKFFNEVESNVREHLPKLLCGPTNQLQFTLIEIQKKFQESERLLIQRKQEIRKLANKYVSFKDGVTQANREKSLLWTFFLTDPENLELTVKKIREESLVYEQKYSKIEG